MFEEVERRFDSILRLTGKCPAPLQEKCFEILLQACVDSTPSDKRTHNTPPPPSEDRKEDDALDNLPSEVANRFKTTAKRLGADLAQLARLFDFNADPFTFHALHVPGKSKAEQTRNVGLLVSAKSYLATGHWSADLKEVRARCVDQNCYDRANFRRYLESPKSGYFRPSENAAAPTPTGIKAAESLLAKLASEA